MHNKFFNYLVWFTIWVFAASCDQSAPIKTISITPDRHWIESNLKFSGAAEEKAADIIVDNENTLQVIEGFGACFNEQGWDVLAFKNPDGEIVIITPTLTCENIREILSSGEKDIDTSLISQSITAFLVPATI